MRPGQLIAIVIIIATTGAGSVSAKSGAVFVTQELRENAIRNCERYDWAANFRDRLIHRVQPWMEMSDEDLWRLLPSQEMPRDSAVNRGDGCPNCGQEHYNAPYSPSRWHVDFFERPWQVRCGNCDRWFPSNDFAAYYHSALDAEGKFRLGEGDPRFLQPREGANPDWVDDGTGIEVGGKKWFTAAFYAFRTWETLIDAAECMALIYTVTGDPTYAHKAGVLLDRMADLYPEMDFAPHFALGMEASSGSSGRGGVQGRIWEAFTAEKLSLAYDHIHDALMQDEALVAFSSRMSQEHATGDKSSPEAIARHIEDRLLREFIARIPDRIRGNPGSHQYAMTCAATVLDDPVETPKALDWMFEPGWGGIPYVLHERLNRDGLSDEAALGYAGVPARSFYQIAEMLQRYDGYSGHDIFNDYPKFRACYTLGAAVRMLDNYSPNWGDGDKCMNYVGRSGITVELDMALQGYRLFGTPEIAREVWFANGRSFDGLLRINPGRGRLPEGIHWHLYDPDPEGMIADLERDADVENPGPLRSHNAGGHGQASLQAPYRENGRALAMYYGRMAGHGHPDRLNYILVDENVVMTPDMGYPLYTGQFPKRFGWTDHVISHNTCMVNDTNPDTSSFSGKTRLFADAGPVRVADVDGGEIYEGVSTYRRCMVMVDVDERDSYVLDVFWVRGGTNHRLIQNGGGPAVTTEGLTLTEQPTGTLAGPDIQYGEPYDGELTSDYAGTGFSFLENVAKAGPSSDFSVDWLIVEPRREMPEDWEAHLRLHNLTPVDEVVLADGIPPAFKGNPPRLRYLLRNRLGEGRESQFVSVLEPYGHEPFIASVRALEVRTDADCFVAAVEVTLADGRRDVLLVSEQEALASAGGVSMDGRVGVARFQAANVTMRALIQGERLEAGGEALELPAAALRGRLAGWDDGDPARVLLHLEGVELTEAVEGRYVIFDNTERSDASYRIEEVVDADTVGIGGKSLIERLADTRDFSKGVIYTIAEGDEFVIAMMGAE